MASRGGGSIVCTASTASFMGEEFQVAYNASKGAVSQLARSMAIDLAPYAIRVNALAPGWIDTPAVTEFFDDEERAEVYAILEALHSDGRAHRQAIRLISRAPEAGDA